MSQRHPILVLVVALEQTEDGHLSEIGLVRSQTCGSLTNVGVEHIIIKEHATF